MTQFKSKQTKHFFLLELNHNRCKIRSILNRLGYKQNWIDKHIDKYYDFLTYAIEQYKDEKTELLYPNQKYSAKIVRIYANEWYERYNKVKVGDERMRWHLRIIKDLFFLKPYNKLIKTETGETRKLLYVHIESKYLDEGFEIVKIIPNTIGGNHIFDENVFENFKDIFNKQASVISKTDIDTKAAIAKLNTYQLVDSNKDITAPNQISKRSYSNSMLEILKIKQRYITQSFSTNTHRIYNNLSRISRNVREFITLDGEQLHEVDVKNSQPLLLAHVLQNDKLKAVCEDGNFYKFLFDKANEYGLTGKIYEEWNKDKFKIHIFRKILFNNYSNEKPSGIQKVFLKEFGEDLWPKLRAFKNLSVDLQQLESKLILQLISSRIMETDIDFLTLHDAIYCKQKDVQFINECVKDVYEKELKVKVKTSYQNPFDML